MSLLHTKNAVGHVQNRHDAAARDDLCDLGIDHLMAQILHTAFDLLRNRPQLAPLAKHFEGAIEAFFTAHPQADFLVVDGVEVATRQMGSYPRHPATLSFDDFWALTGSETSSSPIAPTPGRKHRSELGRLPQGDRERVEGRLGRCRPCSWFNGICIQEFPKAKNAGACGETVRRMRPGFVDWLRKEDTRCPAGSF